MASCHSLSRLRWWVAPAHGRVRLQQPAQCLERHAGIGQGGNVVVAELPAIGVAGAAGGLLAAIYQRDLMAVFGQSPRSGEADDACADDADMGHDSPFWKQA